MTVRLSTSRKLRDRASVRPVRTLPTAGIAAKFPNSSVRANSRAAVGRLERITSYETCGLTLAPEGPI